MPEKNLTLNLSGKELSSRAEWFEVKDDLLKAALQIGNIGSAADFKAAASVQSKIKKHIKTLGEHRLSITRGIDALKQQFMDQEKEFVEELFEDLERIQKVANEYATKVRKKEEDEEKRRQEVERERIQKELEEQEKKEEKFKNLFGENATMEEAPIVVSSPVFEPAKLKASPDAKLVDVWYFKVVDIKKIPREYLKLDEPLVRDFMRREKKANRTPELDGFEFTKETKVQSR